MVKEIGQINQELYLLKPFLKIGEVVPLAECTEPKVEASTILSGEEAIVLILVNHDNTGPSGVDKKPFSWNPKEKFSVTVHIPSWIRIREVYEVKDKLHKISFTRDGNDIIIPVDRLELTGQILLTSASVK